MSKRLFEIQIPITSMTILPIWHTSDTILSTELYRLRLVGKHRHDWLLSHGSGNFVMCAIGSGRFLRPLARSSNAVIIVATAHQHGELAFRDEFIQAALDPKLTQAAYTLSYKVPEGGFPSPASFTDWLAENREFFDWEIASLRERTK